MPQKIIRHDATFAVSRSWTGVARVVNMSGNLITQATIASVKYIVKNQVGTTTSSGTLTKTSVVFDTLQTGAPWEKDSTGYNFLAIIPAAAFSAQDHYDVEFLFTDTSGYTFSVIFAGPAISTFDFTGVI